MINEKTAELASVYTDFNGISQLKAEAGKQSDAAKRETAHQFEALFLQMMIKSMREAGGKGILDSNQTEMARDMYDQQLAINLSKKGSIGIADMVMRQLGVEPEKHNTVDTSKRDARISFATNLWGSAPQSPAAGKQPLPHWKSPEEFVQALYPAASDAAQSLGTSPEAVLAIAALETGWGKHVMADSNGGSSFNLFGIKADKRWQQPATSAMTLEYEDGVVHRKREPFRAYPSAEASVQDFAAFIRENPRYQQALDAASDPDAFLEHIQKAGYATDPDYAEKAKAVMRKVESMTKEIG